MSAEQTNNSLLDDIYPSMIDGPNPEEPQFKPPVVDKFKADGKILLIIAIAAPLLIYVLRSLIGLS